MGLLNTPELNRPTWGIPGASWGQPSWRSRSGAPEQSWAKPAQWLSDSPRRGRGKGWRGQGLHGGTSNMAGMERRFPQRALVWDTPSDLRGLPRWLSGKRICLRCSSCRRLGFDPWVGKIAWRRAWQPTPYSCLENPMDREARQATVHRVPKSQTRLEWLSMRTCSSDIRWILLEKDKLGFGLVGGMGGLSHS